MRPVARDSTTRPPGSLPRTVRRRGMKRPLPPSLDWRRIRWNRLVFLLSEEGWRWTPAVRRRGPQQVLLNRYGRQWTFKLDRGLWIKPL
jgi:hypothetical protein